MKRFILILLYVCYPLFISAQQLSTEQLDKKWIVCFGIAEKEYKEGHYSLAEGHLQTCMRLLEENEAALSVYYFRTLTLLGEIQYAAEERESYAQTIEKYSSLKSSIRPCSKKMVHYLYHGVVLFNSTEDYSSAFSCVQEAIQCSDAVSSIAGMSSKLYHQMAYNHYKTGHINEAIENEKLAVSFDTNDTPLYHKSLLHYLFLAGQWDAFEQELPSCYTTAREPILRQFSQSKAAKRNQFWGVSGLFFTTFIPNYVLAHPSHILTSYAYDAALFSKGILLEATNKSTDLILTSGDSGLIEMYQHYLELKASKQRTLDQQFEMEALEDVIVRYQKEHKYDFRKDFRCDWKMVQAQLSPQDAAIEFISFPLDNGDLQYAALVITKNLIAPRLVPLVTEAQLKSIPSNQYYTTPILYNLVWEPLEEVISDIRTVYFSPTGVFHKLGIEYLPDFLGLSMSIKHQMYRLSSTRELVLHKSKPSHSVALFGGADYNTPITVLAQQSPSYQPIEEAVSRDVPDIQDINSDIGFKYLKGTQEEVDAVSALYLRGGAEVLHYVGQDASETQLKNLPALSPSLLHIATHGFYYAPKNHRRIASMNKVFDDLAIRDYSDEVDVIEEDKMLTRSGLILAGANNKLRNINIPKGVEDGILYADEIASLNLSSLDMVILSACESGLGSIDLGEGVFGLQRGFKIAGTESIMMSLWKVDDQATKILMTSFHENISAGQSKREALENAQLKLRSYDHNKFDYPEYWAAFVLLDGLN